MLPGMSKPVSMQYTKERFESLLKDAEANASCDWDRSFVNDIADRYKIFGSGMYLSTLQRHHLERIATNLESSNGRKQRHHRAA